MQTDDPPQLPGGGADGFQKAIEPDIPGHRDLEHIVDDEIPGENDKQDYPGNGHDRHGVHNVGHPGPGVAPVDAGINVIVPSGLALVAVVFQNLVQIPLDMSGAAFQHHVQIPPACHAVIRAVRIYAHFRQDFVHPAFGNQDMVRHNGLIVFPPATEGEGLSGFVSIYVKSEGKLGPDLRLYTQQFQYMGVGSSLVGALLRQRAFHRVTVHPVGLVGVGKAHLHMSFIERRLPRHTQVSPFAPLADERIILQFIKLRLGHVLKSAVGEAAHLSKIGLLKPIVDGQGDGE